MFVRMAHTSQREDAGKGMKVQSIYKNRNSNYKKGNVDRCIKVMADWRTQNVVQWY
jgi:hypothetical protein